MSRRNGDRGILELRCRKIGVASTQRAFHTELNNVYPAVPLLNDAEFLGGRREGLLRLLATAIFCSYPPNP